jgi:hypothetical protein
MLIVCIFFRIVINGNGKAINNGDVAHQNSRQCSLQKNKKMNSCTCKLQSDKLSLFSCFTTTDLIEFHAEIKKKLSTKAKYSIGMSPCQSSLVFRSCRDVLFVQYSLLPVDS